jgi:polysaccharide export outer membrane protein
MPMSARFRTFLFRLLPLFAAFAVAAAPAAPAPAAGKPAGPAARQGSHKLQAMDLVKVQVHLEPELDRELRVSRDYKLTLPLIGVVDVTNLSVRDAEALITALYARDLIVNPQVNITVLEYAPRTVNVLGAVNAPGAVAIPPEREMGLMDVIARAGGFTRLANRTRISLTRTLPNGEVQNLTINADQLMGGDSSNRWPVQDSDIVLVPERLL